MPRAAFLAWALLAAHGAFAANVGDPLSRALDELERVGLTLIYSSVLITPELRVLEDPGRGASEDVARRLLAPHGLVLKPIRAGTFAIVRAQTPAPDPPPGAAPADAALEEISVYASRYRVTPQPRSGAAELSREDIEALPGLDQDVLRVTKYLPGTANNGISSRPYVRGGRQSELAVYYDGIPLFEPFHFKDFQGLLGVLDTAVVGSMDFYSGVLPVRFGDRLSGALDIEPRRADDTDRWIFGLSPLYASAVVSGRTDTRNIEWLGAGRTSTLGLVLDEIDKRVGDPDFADALARIEMPLKIAGRDDGKLVAGWMLLDDTLDFQDSDDTEEAVASYRDATGWLRGEFPLADHWRLDTALSHTERHTTRRGSIARDNAVGSVDDVRRHDATTARVELSRTVQLSQVMFGVEAAHYSSEYDYRSDVAFDPRFAAAFGRPANVAFASDRDLAGDSFGAYLLYAWEALPSLTVSSGLRWDGERYEGFEANQFSPRLLFDWHPAKRWRFRAAFGRTHQAERPDELQIQDAEDVFHPAQRAEQGVLAVEHQIGNDWSLRVEAFRKHVDHPVPIYENLLDPLVPLPELEVDRVRVAPSGSSAYGVESTLRWQPAERWSGWMAYSWMESQDEFPGFDVPRTWDQRNAVNAGLAWTRRPWQLSGTVQWRSGWRRNALRLVDETTGELELLPRNGLAYPRVITIDLRATWSWPLRASTLHFYADVGNAGNRRTPCCTSYELVDSGGAWSLDREYDSALPRYVLLGVNWEIP